MQHNYPGFSSAAVTRAAFQGINSYQVPIYFTWVECGKCRSMSYTPFTYTNFSYESLRIAQIHGSFTDPYDLATFTTDLSVIKLFAVYYGLLRVIDVSTATVHDLLRVVTDKNEQRTC